MKKTVTIENAEIIFRNFEGKESQYNRQGDRNFAVIIGDDDVAKALLRDGWNVKYLEPRDEGDTPTAYLSVSVNFQNRPPHVVMISGGKRTNLNEESVSVLDYADIASIDLVLNPYEWSVGDKSGVKAYLKTMYVTVIEDDIERKYAEMDDDV